MLSPVMLLVWNGEELAFLVESPVCCGAAQLSPTPSRWERDTTPPQGCHLCLRWQGWEMGFPDGSVVKNSPANAGDSQVQSLGQEDPWRRKWQPTTVFLPGKSHGQRSLEGYSPCGLRESHDLRLNNSSNKDIQEYIEPYSLMFASSMWERAQLGKALDQPPCGEW